VGDFEILKFFVCAMNGWNPYSEEVMRIPFFYWHTAFQMKRYIKYREWEDLYKPQGEFIASLTAPENFSQYLKIKEQRERNEKKGLPDEVKSGNMVSAATEARFDPNLGLVDENGKVLIDKEEFMKRSEMEGIAISY
jgi:hypothetical protein